MKQEEGTSFADFVELAKIVDSLPEPGRKLFFAYGQGLADMVRFYSPAPDQPPQAARPGA